MKSSDLSALADTIDGLDGKLEDSNRSANRSIYEISPVSRRQVLHGGLVAASASLLAPLSLAHAADSTKALRTGAESVAGQSATPLSQRLGFKAVAAQDRDGLWVPEGYEAQIAFMWGEPIGAKAGSPSWRKDASNNAQEQALQLGMHHDGMHYFPIEGSRHGLLAINHEYTDEGLLHPDGQSAWSAEKVAKSMAAHGVSVIEIANRKGSWQIVNPSKYARRITATTPMSISGPARGHPLMQTRDDPQAVTVLGTVNNCANGFTPWGTYLTCEENFVNYFQGRDKPTGDEARWGIRKREAGFRWYEHEERFVVEKHPNEVHRFGWVVEIDPFDPESPPVKRTALGRAAHEGAWVSLTRDQRVVVYMGEDATFEYIYKFVSADKMKPGGYRANKDLLDRGTLFVARFEANGRGEWIALKHGERGLDASKGFRDQAEVLIRSRQASDFLGATKMDRPEWITVDPNTAYVYCTLTNNSRRGAPGQPGVDAANPRANNSMGHIIRWKEDGDFDGLSFSWDHFVLAGDPANTNAAAKGTIRGDAFGSPDGLWCDPRGVLWIQTDASASEMYFGDYQRLGNNALLAADPATGEVRRFMVGPVNCEVTGITATPDLKTLFVNIQHPGESPGNWSDPQNPARYSNWPNSMPNDRPRSATVIIRKSDGGVIGT
ncbi:MAG: PhoX family phosphatase [Betaproteobacteria bacterium]|nr:PhoX family phosphatase [Pseudomonadota bacterium]NBO12463.1 PhoX family phosphatase [Betaproteobacteria bacterium]NBP11383.1 PhoX family phosphatase [Betaproteobacteria bacterium]NBP61795.1 PhoX family phosphatase [Betaproteobacteria bacterium]NBQ08229.1 PhoX family phosphatase [Betaproteobacteria bacterium]